jgi:DNA-binding Lrp family transcriptional regulator
MIGETERKIIRAMTENARRSFREIAKEVGTSVTAVIQAVKRLEAEGVIRGYIPVVDPAQVGFDLTAVVAVRISQGRLLETQRKIAEDPRVFAVYDITGEWDSIVVARFKGREDLNRFLKRIAAVPNVDRTVTHLVLNTVKEERRIFL